MRIFIDIGHPAHVHYFKHLIKIMEKNGHEFFISARNKEVSQYLLNIYNIKYYDRGKGFSNLLGKFFYLIITDFKLLIKAIEFRPTLFLSFASPYLAHISRILQKPHIALTDTENAKLGILSFAPFTKHILTPRAFELNFGSKHIRFNSIMELTYLHPKIFIPEEQLTEINPIDKLVLIRFVSWGANHDLNQHGFKEKDKLKLVHELEKTGAKIIISSEGKLPNHMMKYRIGLPPEKIHSLLYYVNLYIGEGATMASEAAVLGTPSIYVNTIHSGTIEEQKKAGLVYQYTDYEDILKRSVKILMDSQSRQIYKTRRDDYLKDKIDLTRFLVWFIEKYPESTNILKENENYQDKFF